MRNHLMIIVLLVAATVFCLLIAILQPQNERFDTWSTWWILNMTVYSLLVLYRLLTVIFYVVLYIILSRRTIENEDLSKISEIQEDQHNASRFKKQVNIFFSIAISCQVLQLI